MATACNVQKVVGWLCGLVEHNEDSGMVFQIWSKCQTI